MALSHRILGQISIKCFDKHTPPVAGGPLLEILQNLNITPDAAVLYEFTLAAAGTTDLDLNGTLVRSDGSTMNLVKVGGIIFQVDDTGGKVSLTPKAAGGVPGYSTGPSEGLIVYPDGISVWICPQEIPIAAGATDLLTALETGGVLGATCKAMVWGSIS